MNSYINELSALVPKCLQTNKKMDKLTVLKLAVQHLKDLRGKVKSTFCNRIHI